MQVTRAAIVLQMLWGTAQHRPCTYVKPCTYGCPAFDNSMSPNGSSCPNGNLFTDDSKRAYPDSISKFCCGMYNGPWVDGDRHRFFPSRGLSAKNTWSSASAARASST